MCSYTVRENDDIFFNMKLNSWNSSNKTKDKNILLSIIREQGMCATLSTFSYTGNWICGALLLCLDVV